VTKAVATDTQKKLAATQAQPGKQSPDSNQRTVARILRGNSKPKPR
jgi:hypothetical protein